ncbi:MAG TPA: hypothetical protein GX734_03505 [Clostridiaceae bacterium]|nr:hypothetical protein [Clostridiaceae bacterium]
MKTPKGEISDSIIALTNDEALLQKMSECKSPEEVYALVKDRVGIPFEQFTAEMTIAHSYLQEMEAGLLSDDDLDAVAGGKTLLPYLDGPYVITPEGPIALATIQSAL